MSPSLNPVDATATTRSLPSSTWSFASTPWPASPPSSPPTTTTTSSRPVVGSEGWHHHPHQHQRRGGPLDASYRLERPGSTGWKMGAVPTAVELLHTPPSTPPRSSTSRFLPPAAAAAVTSASSAAASRKEEEEREREEQLVVRRPLSANELSYFLPSRAHGVNDMYLHHRLSTSAPHLLTSDRLELIWALLLVRHPLLGAHVVRLPPSSSDDNASSSSERPRSADDDDESAGPSTTWAFESRLPVDRETAAEAAWERLTLTSGETDEELISRYLNGPRQLGPTHLAHLTFSTPPASSLPISSSPTSPPPPSSTSPPLFSPSSSSSTPPSSSWSSSSTPLPPPPPPPSSSSSMTVIDVLLTTTHFIGDGIALHTLADELYRLIGDERLTTGELGERLGVELAARREQILLFRRRRRRHHHLGDDDKSGRGDDEGGAEEGWVPRSIEQGLLGQGPTPTSTSTISTTQEEALEPPSSSAAAATAKAKGGQTFPRPPRSTAFSSSSAVVSVRETATTVVPTRSFTVDESKRLLITCKQQGVTFASALFAVVNRAWGTVRQDQIDPKEPMMFYSALNLRPSLPPPSPSPSSGPTTSFFHLALGYYTVSLPSFPSSSSSSATADDVAGFWHRARSIKAQTSRATRSPILVERCLAEFTDRRERAERWAQIDDAKAAAAARAAAAVVKEEEGLMGLGIVGWPGPPVELAPAPRVEVASKPTTTTGLPTPPSSPIVGLSVPSATTTFTSKPPLTPPTPSAATATAVVPTPAPTNTPLMGLSLLGNLDALYAHASYPSLQLEKLTTGSRQRPGAILLFGYSFKGQTYLSLGYDKAGFEPGVVERLWDEMNDVTERLLVGSAPAAAAA